MNINWNKIEYINFLGEFKVNNKVFYLVDLPAVPAPYIILQTLYDDKKQMNFAYVISLNKKTSIKIAANKILPS